MPVSAGTVELYRARQGSVFSSCAAQTGAAETSAGVTGTPNGSGQVSFDLQALALTLTPGTWGFIVKFEQNGTYHKSQSSCLDLIVTPVIGPCAGPLTIAADISAGNGAPPPGSLQIWNITVTIHACENVTNVSAQGGFNAWAATTLGIPSDGTLQLRKITGNGKNQVWIWTLGAMNAGNVQTLPITVVGNIKAGTPCNTVLGLLGSWSALFSTNGGASIQKSSYTGTTTATVTCP